LKINQENRKELSWAANVVFVEYTFIGLLEIEGKKDRNEGKGEKEEGSEGTEEK
jgi:hypothetical protein